MANDVVADEYSVGPFLTVARVTRVGSLVINVEIANQDWVDTNTNDPYFLFVVSPDKDGNSATIGLHYSISTGLFEVPPKPKED